MYMSTELLFALGLPLAIGLISVVYFRVIKR
jgi:hypothetical protein